MFKELLKLLVRFVPPYKKYFILNLVFNILSTVLTLFSFATIIPILEILFKISILLEESTDYLLGLED